MEYLQNLHTHSTFCDGKDTPAEMILSAKEQGFQSIGFSAHSYMHYSNGGMKPENEALYRKEIARLKDAYADEIDIFCGLEFDMYSEVDLSGYDYLIGSVHYLLMDGVHVGFDRRTPDIIENIIKTYFGGNGMAYAKKYYETLAHLPEYGNFDIAGHFDIITKFCEKADFFDTESKEYRMAALEALHALAEKIPFFEVNTGAISRGFRTTPYPADFILKELKALGKGIVLSSDCHDSRNLTCYFKEATERIKACGFEEIYVLKKGGFEPISLD